MKRFSLYPYAVALFAVVALAGAGRAQAQVRPSVDLNFIVGLPQGEFREHVDATGFGGTLLGSVGVGHSPLVLGVELGAMIYGFDRRREPFSSTIPDVTVDVETSNNVFMGHFVVRLQPPSGAVRPYVDGLVGMKYLWTETRIENRRDFDDEPIAVSTNFDDAAFSYGAGGGVDVRLYDGPLGEEQRPVSISLNVGVCYLLGAEAEYLKEGSIRQSGGSVGYDVERSTTHLLVPQFGVRFGF